MTTTDENLTTLLADLNVHYHKLRGCHWNVTGPAFFQLHAEFQRLYEAAAVRIDDVAERLRARGQRPESTLSGYLRRARLEEKDLKEADAMVRDTVSDLERLCDFMEESAAAADEEGDRTTADLLRVIADEQKKDAWMLGSWLG